MNTDNGISEIKNRVIKTEKVYWKSIKQLQQSNFKELSSKLYKKLKQSLLKNDFIQTFYVWEDKDGQIYILDGVHRIKVLQELEREGYLVPATFPAIFIDCKDRKEAAKLVLVYSSAYAKITDEGLYEFLTLEGLDFGELKTEIEIPSINMKNFEIGFIDNNPEAADELDLLSDNDRDISEMGRTFSLVPNIDFDGKGQFDFPPLVPGMIVEKSYVKDLSIYYGKDTATKPPYYFIYGSYSISKTNLKGSLVGFYTEDHRFEKIFTEPDVVTTNLLNAKIYGAITPDFSTYFSMPAAIRIYNMYRSFWCGRYLQESGIKVIPNVIGSINEIDELFKAIPENSPVSFQIHRKYNSDELEHKREIIKRTIDKVKPQYLILYSEPEKLNVFEDLFKGQETFIINTFINERRKLIGDK